MKFDTSPRKSTLRLKTRLCALSATAATCVMLALPAQAALLGRDISGEAIAGSDASAVEQCQSQVRWC